MGDPPDRCEQVERKPKAGKAKPPVLVKNEADEVIVYSGLKAAGDIDGRDEPPQALTRLQS